MALLGEAWRIWRLSSRRKRRGWKRYAGLIQEICSSIMEDCWDGTHYCASAGHFHQFYCRDIGIAAEGLDKERLRKTLDWALAIFERQGKVTVAITPKGVPFDFPVFSPDSLAFLLRSLRIAGDKKLVDSHRAFLEREISKWCARVIAEDGFVKRDVHFGGMRDHAIRSSSAYDNAMVLLLKREAASLGLRCPPIALTQEIFLKEFWTGAHIRDARNNPALSGDANIVPFWLGVIKDDEKARICVRMLHESGMDRPPLAYSAPGRKSRVIWQNIFVGGWEEQARWLQLGLMYAVVAKSVDKTIYEQAKSDILDLIKRDANVLEVYTPGGKPYRSLFYHSDEGMLWGAALARALSS